jgi:voltage-gated hydrogen channel 1
MAEESNTTSSTNRSALPAEEVKLDHFGSGLPKKAYECTICASSDQGDGKWHHRVPLPSYWSKKSHPCVPRVAAALESMTMHYIIIALVLIDLVVTMLDLVLADIYKCEEDPPEAYERTENALIIISLTILGLFILEQLVKLVIFGIKYFFVFWHLFDAFIIITAFVLEITLTGSAEIVAPLLVILRMWRIVRVGHAVADAIKLEQHILIKKHHDHIAMLIAQLQASEITVPQFILLANRETEMGNGVEEW